MEAQQWNLVNESIEVKPNYKLEGRVNSISTYLNIKNELLIIGRIDNNYICWLSKTKADDREKNEQIFNYLASGSFEIVSQTEEALKSIGISYEEWRHFYKERYDRGDEKEPEKVWKLSSGGYYRECDIQQHGQLFAFDMERMLTWQQEKCRAREADGEYLKALEKYLKKLEKGENDAYYYDKEYQLIQLLEQESYLLLSKDKRVRTIYFQIQEKIHSLYCTYMSAVK